MSTIPDVICQQHRRMVTLNDSAYAAFARIRHHLERIAEGGFGQADDDFLLARGLAGTAILEVQIRDLEAEYPGLVRYYPVADDAVYIPPLPELRDKVGQVESILERMYAAARDANDLERIRDGGFDSADPNDIESVQVLAYMVLMQVLARQTYGQVPALSPASG